MSRSELRYDPLTRRWTIIAAERRHRPIEAESGADPRACPFCEGNEAQTPSEVHAVRPRGSPCDGPGWSVRVIPNRYPALFPDGRAAGRDQDENEIGHPAPDFAGGGGLGGRPCSAQGVQEVVVETPRHEPSTPAPASNIALLLRVYRDRMRALLEDPRYGHAFFFKNCGRPAGASLAHPHSQVVALVAHPPAVLDEIAACRAYRTHVTSTMLGDELERELASGARIVTANDVFAVYCPQASRFPFEVRLLPRAACADFRALSDGESGAAAEVFAPVLRALHDELDAPPYNYFLRSVPGEPAFHWHIDLLPRVTGVAGFEWASGIHINPIPPEEAAARLRGRLRQG